MSGVPFVSFGVFAAVDSFWVTRFGFSDGGVSCYFVAAGG